MRTVASAAVVARHSVRLWLIANVAMIVAACSSDGTSTPDAVSTAVSLAGATNEASAASLPPGAPAEPALREELLEMQALDQAVRTGEAPPGDNRTPDELFATIDEVDTANQRRIAQIVGRALA